MSDVCLNPDRLFDRVWRPRHPLRPRVGPGRRWGMRGLLLLLCAAIGGYVFVTDEARVRRMAGDYLADLLGGQVEIGGANLSLFEGLRLDRVSVRVNGTAGPESTLLEARTVFIHYSLRELVAGRLAATQIIAVNPHVRLAEDVGTHRWNYQRLGEEDLSVPPARRRRRPAPQAPPETPPALPEILLRDAQVDYLAVSGGKASLVGWMNLEGRFSPTQEADNYEFSFQSRGREALGPTIDGAVRTRTGQVSAKLRNFSFGPDIKTMLPSEVRQWCEDHDLQGRLNVTMDYTPPKPAPGGSRAPVAGSPATLPGLAATQPGTVALGAIASGARFRVETELDGVDLSVRPREWTDARDDARRARLHAFLAAASRTHWFKPELIEGFVADTTPVPVTIRDVSGTLVFTDGGIAARGLTGRVENNWVKVSSRIDGYSPDAPFDLTVGSVAGRELEIPPTPRYVPSMPGPVREIYERLRPTGRCAAEVRLVRAKPGGVPDCTARVDILDGAFTFSDFPYPVRKATGRITVGRDPVLGFDVVRMTGVRGRGVEGGPNADAVLRVDGWVGPLDEGVGGRIDVAGEGVREDPAVRAALPPPARQALDLFDPTGRGEFPKYTVSFHTHSEKSPGRGLPWVVSTDLDVSDASGTFAPFPYPLDHASGTLRVRDNFVDVVGLTARHGPGTVRVDGRVAWTDPSKEPPAGAAAPPKDHGPWPDLRLRADDVPIDRALLAALPPRQRHWLEAVGAAGKVDMTGRVYRGRVSPEALRLNPSPDPDFDLRLTLRDGSVWPADGTFSADAMTGHLRLTPDRLEVIDLAGRRGGATLAGHGQVRWGAGRETVSILASAENLALDPALYRLLPPAAREGWDGVRPTGTVDAVLTYDDRDPRTTEPGVEAYGVGPTTRPGSGVRVTLRPRDLSVSPLVAPYALDHVTGTVTLDPTRVTLADVTGRHGDARVSVSGVGKLDDPARPWDLRLAARDVTVDADLMKAMPEILTGAMQSLKLAGKLDVEFTKLVYRTPAGPHGPLQPQTAKGATPATQPSEQPDVDFAASVSTAGAAVDVGVPLDDIHGTLSMAGTVRGGRLGEMAGELSADSLKLAGRPARDLRATISKPAGEAALRVEKLQASVAGGDLAGQMVVAYPDDGPSRYALGLVLRGADVRELAPPGDKKLRGKLSASLDVSGSWTDPATRRGRGDVLVTGNDMYRIPLVLGLLQITNLSLPINSPFEQATARYSLDGQRVSLEQILLKSKDMVMQGSGHLDFATKKVDLTFATDNPNWPTLPVVGQMWNTARRELLRIHVNGSLQAPEVSASTLDVVTTTVDEVFNGDGGK